MIDFLHTFTPSPVLSDIGPITIYWYGLFVVLGVVSALFLSIKLGKGRGIPSEKIIDLALWLIVAGIIGARIYDVILELPYYLERPLDAFKVWQGGLAIHGALIGGGLALWLFSKKEKMSFWLMADILAPGIALGQAIGRWGNYFNQELFGLPTDLPWGIPIMPWNRPAGFVNADFFHPTFLYESLGNLVIFIVLASLYSYNIKNQKRDLKTGLITAVYFISYSLLRFSLEFIRIDYAPEVLSLRWPQWASLLIMAVALAALLKKNKKGDKV